MCSCSGLANSTAGCGMQWFISGLTHGGLDSGDVWLGKAEGWCTLCSVNGWVGRDRGGAASTV